MNIQELFTLGMKRPLAQLIDPFAMIPKIDGGQSKPRMLNLGAGNSLIDGAINLDFPVWDAETMDIPELEGNVDAIFAFHFLEHLPSKRIIHVLRECERVLKVGGTLNIVVPHRLGSMAYHDLDHKTFFCEDTWKILFSTPYYDKGRETPWRFKIHFNLIAGLVERNLCVMTQLIKTRAVR